MENRICVYAITKNEEQFVDRWFESMKEADSIVVLDTGSTDNTVEKLRSHGVTVEVKEITPWRFDVARNESLKLVPEDCNILICTDLDEVLEPGWAKPLRDKWIEGVHERGVYKYTWSHLADGSDGRIFQYDKIHSRKWLWRAPVHELLYNADTNSNEYHYDNILNLFDEVHLHHYPDNNKSRASYLPLLELRAKENPTDYYGLIYLSHEYYYRGKYTQSIDLLNRILRDYPDKYSDVEKASCYLFMGDSYNAIANTGENKEENQHNAIDCYIKAMRVENSYIESYLNIAKVYMAMGNNNAAVFYVKEGLRNSYRHYTWLERDTSWSYEPWDLLCIASYYAGNVKDSIAYAAKALSFSPDDERLKSNLKLCLAGIDDKKLVE